MSDAMSSIVGAAVLEKLEETEIKFSGLEDNVPCHGTYLEQLEIEVEEDRNELERVKERVSKLEENEKRQHEEFVNQLYNINREYDEKYTQAEWQNDEMRAHLNTTTDAVNNIIRVLNMTIDSVNNINEVLKQGVEVKFETQDEEAWEEMTNIIKAAQEYEKQAINENFV